MYFIVFWERYLIWDPQIVQMISIFATYSKEAKVHNNSFLYSI